MYLIIRDKEKELNRFEDCTVSFLEQVWAYATKRPGIRQMKVVDHMDETANVHFYLTNGVIYTYKDLPLSHGLLLGHRL